VKALASSFALSLALVAGPLQAAPDARAQREIDALLAFVASSDCAFVRGGTSYPGPDASKHLARKLGSAGSMISTADAFVDHVASASSLTGEPYRVMCRGKERTARDWLREELVRMRRGETRAR
jgi:Family of unknown function (DUF5329)